MAQATPFALTLPLKGGPRLVALDRAAEAAGLRAGQLLSDARPLCPDLRVRDADPAADRAGLARLADWCGRYTPWTAVWPGTGQQADGLLGPALGPDDAGFFLDITGCAHLFGGEAALLRDLNARLSGFGIASRAALADTPGAAWALSRHGGSAVDGPAAGDVLIAPPGGTGPALAPLPVAALRLSAETVSLLTGLGLKTVGALAALPRAPLATRFGADLLRRLDQAWGREEEPISPAPPIVPYRARLVLAEPITDQAHVAHGLERLAHDLTGRLGEEGRGARRFALSLYQVDGHVQRLEVGAARPVAEPAHVARLFAEAIARLGGALDAGFGIDVLVLDASDVEEVGADQYAFLEEGGAGTDRFDPDISALMDRLGNRLGLSRVRVFEPVESHVPERAVLAVPVGALDRRRKPAPAWGRASAHGVSEDGRASGEGPEGERPLALLPCAEPIEVMAGVPEGPPRLFRWRKATFHVVRSDGPERIAPEWWRAEDEGAHSRDYYRVEDKAGRRFWLYRHGLYERETSEPKWYLHGFFS